MSETRFDVEVETLSSQLPFEGRSGILLGKPSEPVQPWPKDPPPEGRYYMRFAQSRPGTASPGSAEAAVRVSHAARVSRFRVAAAESTLMTSEVRTTSTSSAAGAISSAGISEVTGISQYRVSETESTLANAAARPSSEQPATTVSTSLSASATRPSGVGSGPTHTGNVTSGTASLSTGRQGVATASVSASARRLK